MPRSGALFFQYNVIPQFLVIMFTLGFCIIVKGGRIWSCGSAPFIIAGEIFNRIHIYYHGNKTRNT